MALHVPHVSEDTPTLDAALAYIEAGWFIVPVRYGQKNPGSVVGKAWQDLSSRDPNQIKRWFGNGGRYNIALHAGKSGAVIIDLDSPEQMPEVIQRAIDELHPPYQSTRRGDTGRGHFLFDAGDVSYSNSIGKLPPGFGDVRGRNGVIVVSPSLHEKHESGGLYTWNVTGPVPKLPAYVGDLLTEAGETAPELGSAEADDFITSHNRAERPKLLDFVETKFRERLESGDSRHEVLKKTLPWALRESIAGYYPAEDVYTRFRELFVLACQTSSLGSGSLRSAEAATMEFQSVFKWAAAQALLADPEETREAINQKMAIPGPKQVTDDDTEWLHVTNYQPDPTRWLAPHMLNDTGNAERLSHLLQDKVRFVVGAGWHVWNGKVWLPEGEDSVHEMVRNANRLMWEDLNERIRTGGDVTPTQYKHFHYSVSSPGIRNSVAEMAKTHTLRWTPEQVDSYPDLLAVRNGVVDLRTGEMREHDPKLGLTRILDVDYDPNASAPRWVLFMEEIFPKHPELIPFMQRLIGYGSTGHVSEHAMAIFYGRGRNGKSVFLNTLDFVFASITASADWTSFERQKGGTGGGARGDLARLRGARLVHVSEGNQGSRIDEAKLKQMVAGDKLTVRAIYQKDMEFAPSFLLMMATNAKPDFQGADDGLWERVKLIPFEAYFGPDQRDPGLTDKLRAEAQGILTWAVQGAMSWYRGGLQEPKVVKDATKEYRETNDPLHGYIGADAILVPDNEGHVPVAWAYVVYKSWADSEGLQPGEILKRKNLMHSLEERGYPKAQTADGRISIHGLSANADHDIVRIEPPKGGTKQWPQSRPDGATVATGTFGN